MWDKMAAAAWGGARLLWGRLRQVTQQGRGRGIPVPSACAGAGSCLSHRLVVGGPAQLGTLRGAGAPASTHALPEPNPVTSGGSCAPGGAAGQVAVRACLKTCKDGSSVARDGRSLEGASCGISFCHGCLMFLACELGGQWPVCAGCHPALLLNQGHGWNQGRQALDCKVFFIMKGTVSV